MITVKLMIEPVYVNNIIDQASIKSILSAPWIDEDDDYSEFYYFDDVNTPEHTISSFNKILDILKDDSYKTALLNMHNPNSYIKKFCLMKIDRDIKLVIEEETVKRIK